MVGFIIGSMFGGTVGVVAMCLCSAASRDDELHGREDERPYRRIK